MRVLFAMRDPLPPFRADVKTLFGKYLFRKGVSSDLIGRAQPNMVLGSGWEAGNTYISCSDGEGLFKTFYCCFLESFYILWYARHADIIQVRDRVRLFPAAWIAAKLWGVPLVYWVSFPITEGHYLAYRMQNFYIRKLILKIRYVISFFIFYKLMGKYSDFVFVQSEPMKTWLTSKGVDAKKMQAVPMGLDLDLVREVNLKAKEKNATDFTLCYLGSISKARESDFLLDVLSEIHLTQSHVKLLIIGDGVMPSDVNWFREEVAAKGLDSFVEITGWLPQKEGLVRLQAVDLGLSPIPRGILFDVSSPTKAIEYLGFGIACVGNDIPDQKLVLEESGAGICVPMNVQAFASAVVFLIKHPEILLEMAANGPSYVEENRSYFALSESVFARYHKIIERFNYA